jgi:C1A family cysteine protease
MKLGEFTPDLVMNGETKELKNVMSEELSPTSNLRGPSRETPTAIARTLLTSDANDGDDDDEEELDWHKKGLLGPIRNQGICGACWAFATIGSIESAMAIDEYNKMTPDERTKLHLTNDDSADLGLVIPLSEQNLIDCDTRFEKGCEGGLMTTTFDEEENHNGICSEADYPYLATDGTCSSSTCTPVKGSIVKDHVDIAPRKTKALVEALKVKPVTAAMVANDPMLQFYSSGIYDSDYGKVTKEMGDPECMRLYEGQDVCLPDINHGVLVVGYGKDEMATTDNNLFFKIKNSWGDTWGEDGYLRLARKDTDPTDPLTNWGECGILTMLSYPVMETL